MNYEQLEQDVVNRLAPFATVGVSVTKMPENDNERIFPESGKARFTVIYAGSEYENVQSTAQVSQHEDIFVAVLIESNVLRGNRGIYNLLSVLKTALIGFKPTGCQRLTAVKHHTLGSPEAVKKDNTWQYQVIFKTSSLAVENFEEDISILLKKITLNDGNEHIIIPPETT